MTQSAPPPPPPSASPPPPSRDPQPNPEGREPDVRKDNAIALASLVVGLAALLLSVVAIGGIIAIIAIVMAGVGIKRSKATGVGRGLAIGGIALSILAILMSILSTILIIEAIEDGVLSLEGFDPDPSGEEFPIDDDLVLVECTEDGLALAIITVENNTEDDQRYTVAVTWETDLDGELVGTARSDFVEPGNTAEIRLFERSSAAIIDSCELDSFTRSTIG